MALKAPYFSSLKNALKKSQNLKRKVLKKVLREKTSLIGYLKKLTTFLYLASAAHMCRIISKANCKMGIGPYLLALKLLICTVCKIMLPICKKTAYVCHCHFENVTLPWQIGTKLVVSNNLDLAVIIP